MSTGRDAWVNKRRAEADAAGKAAAEARAVAERALAVEDDAMTKAAVAAYLAFVNTAEKLTAKTFEVGDAELDDLLSIPSVPSEVRDS